MKFDGKFWRQGFAAAVFFAASLGAAAAQQSDYAPSNKLTFDPFQANGDAEPAPGAAPRPASGTSDDDLARDLSNPIANLVSVPLQNNLDYGGGLKGAGSQYLLNIQPVIPFNLNNDWNLIVRTIVPFTSVVNIFPDNPVGLGDTIQSFFFSPSRPANGILWGVGPVFLYPTATRGEISANQWGAGPTFVALAQSNGFTVGVLANQIWGIGEPGVNGLDGGSILAEEGYSAPLPPGRSARVNVTFLQPFASYTFPTHTTLSLSSESTYNWTAGNWSVPISAGISQLLKVGGQPISIGLTGKYWAERPVGAPEWGARLTLTLLFPK